MADETLLLLAREVRGKTLRILTEVTEAKALWAPPGLSNSILWHAGHALIVVEHLSVSGATGKPPVYPADWFEKFSWTSKPATVKSWPSLEEVRAKLVDQAERLTSAITGLSETQLNQPTGDGANPRTLRFSIFHG